MRGDTWGRRTKDAFSIDSSATFQNILGQVLNNFGAVVAAIASISLVVGGIVIMNITCWWLVTERTREIGVRQGAWRKAQRHPAAIPHRVRAALALWRSHRHPSGIALAKGITLAISFPSAVELWSVIASLFVSTAVGLFFGIYPAYKAASLDPIVALRAEL